MRYWIQPRNIHKNLSSNLHDLGMWKQVERLVIVVPERLSWLIADLKLMAVVVVVVAVVEMLQMAACS